MSESSAVYRFGAYDLDTRTGELRKSGVRIRLGGQPLEVLTLLVERQGELVTRDELKELLWKQQSFTDFDHGVNTAIQRIRRALGDSAQTPRFIETLPRKGYRFAAMVARLDAPELAPSPPQPLPWRVTSVVAAAVFATSGYMLWPGPEALVFTERAVTHSPGPELFPDISPDGTRVAYNWDGDGDGIWDIYIKHIDSGSGGQVRVTAGPRNSKDPAWSPDGSKIVFARFDRTRPPPLLSRFQFVVVSPTEGSSEKVLDEFQTRSQQVFPSWSPDGDHIGFSCHINAPAGLRQICIYSLQSREVWPVTFPTGDVGDGLLRFRPDGGAIAYQSDGRLLVQDLSKELQPVGEPKTLAPGFAYPDPAGWSSDGRDLFFIGDSPNGVAGLWTLSPSPDAEPRFMWAVNPGAQAHASVWWSPSGRMRLAYEQRDQEADIMQIDLGQPTPGEPSLLTNASGLDFNPEFSPDGRRIAFMSNQTGVDALWTTNSDGSNQHPLAALPPFARYSHPQWSPDGTRIAIDAIFETTARDVYIVDVESGRVGPHLTTGGGRWPAWSNDGRFLYYQPGNQAEIWRLDVTTGEKGLFLPKYGDSRVAESSDSGALYLLHNKQLLKAPLNGRGLIAGEPIVVADESRTFAVASGGIFSMTLAGEVHFHDEKTGGVRRVADDLFKGWLKTLPFSAGFSVSRDQKRLLFTAWTRDGADIKLLETVE